MTYIPGVDILGAAHKLFPLRDVIKLVPKDYAIGLLDDFFGDAERVFRKLYRAGFRVFRVHGHWSKAHTFVPKRKAQKFAQKWGRLHAEFPDVVLYLSPSLEHRNKNKAEVREVLALVKAHAPNAIPVNSVIDSGAIIAGEVTEVHGFGARDDVVPYIVSADGDDILSFPAEEWRFLHRFAEIVFGWTPPFNMRERDEAGTPPPPEARKRKPTPAEIKDVVKRVKGK